MLGYGLQQRIKRLRFSRNMLVAEVRPIPLRLQPVSDRGFTTFHAFMSGHHQQTHCPIRPPKCGSDSGKEIDLEYPAPQSQPQMPPPTRRAYSGMVSTIAQHTAPGGR